MARSRVFRNYGYSQSGASTAKKSMQGWTAMSRTPQEDIDFNLHTLRQRSRDLYMSAPIAVSAIKTNRTNVVGSGLRLKSRLDIDVLGITREQAAIQERNIEREWLLWATSRHCDATKVNSFAEMQQLALMSWLLNGDVFGLTYYKREKVAGPYSLRIHLIEADRVSTPNTYSGYGYNSTIAKLDTGNWIFNGVEIDSAGAIVAYHICNQYPDSMLKGYDKKWTRVEAFGAKTGQQNVLHLMESERCEQYRGVPYLAPVIETIKQMTRYTEAELTAAVVQSFFSAFIKTDAPASEMPFMPGIETEERLDYASDSSYEMGSGTINVMQPGEDIVFADPTRPNSGFDTFTVAMSKQIGAALEIPFELLLKSFMASYSASRAALLEAWKAFRMRRNWFANDFCQPVFELFFAEAVALGRISAPGYFVDPIIRRAYTKAEWIGPSPGQIDPVKEVTAATKRVEQGYSTRERETTELTGGSWDDNIEQLKRENKRLNDALGLEVPTNV